MTTGCNWSVTILAWFLPLFSGCSLIGFGIGAAIDGAQPDTTAVASWSEWELKGSDSITVSLRDGSRVTGEFREVSLLPDSMYERRYANTLDNATLPLPRLRDSVKVTVDPNAYGQFLVEGIFRGFSIDKSLSRSQLLVETGDRTNWLAVENIKSLYSRGERILGSELAQAISAGKVQFNSGLILSTSGGDTLIPVNDVRARIIPTERNAKWNGLAVGAIIDAVVVVAVIVGGGLFDGGVSWGKK